MRILVVDDEAELADAIAKGLRREGHAVDVAYTGEESIAKLETTHYDLVCLDLTLPDIDGTEICRRVRKEGLGGGPRVLMVTARDSVDDRVEGLDTGADDYLVKPFAYPELNARVRTLLRRDEPTGAVLRVADLELDTVRHIAQRSGRELPLTAKEFALLNYFMLNADSVLPQEQLLEHVWDENADPFTNTVRVTVGTLRRKLTSRGEPQLIDTVVGRGYVLRSRSS